MRWWLWLFVFLLVSAQTNATFNTTSTSSTSSPAACGTFGDCDSCVSRGCLWCPSNKQCSSQSSPYSSFLSDDCDTPFRTSCIDCVMISNCSKCVIASGCAWCPETDACVYSIDSEACFVFVYSCPASHTRGDVPSDGLYVGFAIAGSFLVGAGLLLFGIRWKHARAQKRLLAEQQNNTNINAANIATEQTPLVSSEKKN